MKKIMSGMSILVIAIYVCYAGYVLSQTDNIIQTANKNVKGMAKELQEWKRMYEWGNEQTKYITFSDGSYMLRAEYEANLNRLANPDEETYRRTRTTGEELEE